MMVKQYLSARDHILSNSVHDEVGEKIGKVHDILIDPEDNQPKIAILSDGGVLGIGGEYLALPFHLLRFNTNSSDISLKVAAQRIKKAPSIDLQKLKGHDKEEYEKLVRYYGVNALENAAKENVDSQQYTGERPTHNPHEGYEGSAKTTGEQPKTNQDSNPADDMDYEQLKWGKEKGQ